jgi:Cytochrome c oxidase subunit IV
MRVEMLLWGGLVLYYVVLGAIYWAVDGDAAGATLLLMATALGGLVAGWIWDWRRHHAHPRAEDQVDGDASDATGVVGVFPSASIRPLALAVGATSIVLGVVIGSWMLFAGVAITSSQVLLLTRDADR